MINKRLALPYWLWYSLSAVPRKDATGAEMDMLPIGGASEAKQMIQHSEHRPRAFFPISVGSRRFSTDAAKAGLLPLLGCYSDIVFVIFESLHLYNRASGVKNTDQLNEMFRTHADDTHISTERRAWIESIAGKLRSHNTSEWVVFRDADLRDAIFSRLFRNILVSYESVAAFREDVCQDIDDRLLKESASGHSLNKRELIKLYILEEIALNLRVRVFNELHDEYYLGDSYFKSLLGIYNGAYGISIEDLCGKSVAQQFRFFTPASTSGDYWHEYCAPQTFGRRARVLLKD